MTCHAKEIAQRVVLYQELNEQERAEVDLHLTQCEDCARTFWALDRFMAKLCNIGEQRRMSLVHPAEEEIIQLAVDPALLQPAQRARVLAHLKRSYCAPCERTYWSVLESEKECAQQEKEESRARLWQEVIPVWRKPAFVLALVLLIVQAAEIRQIWSMKQQMRRQQTEFSARTMAQPEPKLTSPTAAERSQAVVAREAEVLRQNQQQQTTIAGLRKQLQPYLKPRADSAYVLLLSTGRGGDAIPTAELQASKLFVILQANLSKELGQYKGYKLVLRNSQGTLVKSDQTKKLEETLNYLVRKELLKPGSYTLQIYGVDSGQERYLVQFPFRVAVVQ